MRLRSFAVAFASIATAGVVHAAPDVAIAPATDYTALECLRVLQDAAAATSPERRQAVEYCVAYLAFRTRQLNDGLDAASAPAIEPEPSAAPDRVTVPVVPRESAPVPATVAEEITPVAPPNPPAVEPPPAMRAEPVPAPRPGLPQPPKFLEGF